MRNQFDVIVVGGGVAGLMAGATAAAAGADTVVLEAHRPGGRARTVERRADVPPSAHEAGPFTFNMGAHAFYRGGAGARVLGALGVTPPGTAPPLSRYRALVDGAQTRLPTGPASLLATGALGVRDKAQFARLLTRLPKLRPSSLAGTSVAEWLGAEELRPRVEAVVRALVRLSTYAADVTSFAADAAVGQVQLGAGAGVVYLNGGWAPLLAALAGRVEVRTGTAVRAVGPAAGQVEVRTDGERLVGRQVVLAAGTPGATGVLLGGGVPWGDLGGPVTAACLDVGVRGVPVPGYLLGIDEPLYGTVQSPPASGQAPGGCSVVALVRYGARSAAEDEQALRGHLHRLGVGDHDVVVERFLAKMSVSGTLPRAGLGGLAGRPTVGGSGVPGVWLAGDWIGPVGMLADAALASGHDAARRAVRALDHRRAGT